MVCQFDTDQCLVQCQLCPRDIDVGLIILQSAFCTDLCFLCPVAVNHNDASGFITLFGLPLKVRAMMLAEVEKKNLGE